MTLVKYILLKGASAKFVRTAKKQVEIISLCVYCMHTKKLPVQLEAIGSCGVVFPLSTMAKIKHTSSTSLTYKIP